MTTASEEKAVIYRKLKMSDDTAVETPCIKVGEIKTGNRVRKDMGDIEKLATSISVFDLIHPVVLSPTYELLAGRRRLAACKKLGWDYIPFRVVDPSKTSKIEIEGEENTQRKDFTTSESVEVTRKIQEKIAAAAELEARLLKQQGKRTDLEKKEEKAETSGDSNGHAADAAESEVPGIDRRSAIALGAGFSNHMEYSKSKDVIDAGCDELVEALDKKEVSLDDAHKIVKAGLNKTDQKSALSKVRKGEAGTLAKAAGLKKHTPKKRVKKVMEDSKGQSVPKNLVDLFSDTTLQDMSARLLEDIRIVRKLAGKYPYLSANNRIAKFIEAMEASSEIADSVSRNPHVCTACQGRKCNVCLHSGWMPEWRYKEAKASGAFKKEEDATEK